MWPNVSKTVNNSKNVSFAKSALTYVLGKGTLSEMHFLVKTALFGKTTPPWTLWFPPPGTLWFHTTVDSLVSKPGQYWAIQANTGPYWPIQVNTGPYRPIQANTGPYWAKLGQTGPNCVISVQTGPNCVISGQTESFLVKTDISGQTVSFLVKTDISGKNVGLAKGVPGSGAPYSQPGMSGCAVYTLTPGFLSTPWA